MWRVLAVAVALGLTACSSGDSDITGGLTEERRQTTTTPVKVTVPELPAAPVLTTPPTTEPVVTYEVEGSGSALVTYGTAGFNQEQHSVVLPWSHEIRGDVPEFPTLVAQLNSEGEITCRIWGGGTVPLAESTSSGPYVVVTCSGD